MAIYRQEPPFAIQIELTEGCNLYCDFCGLQGIRTASEKNFKFMTVDTARKIATAIAEAGWNSRIEFAMHGEPTLNKDRVEIVRLFREALPRRQLMMTSNGGGLLSGGVVRSLTDLFDAGLNVFAFDAYEYVNIKDKVAAQLLDNSATLTFDVHHYPDEPEFSPHNRYHHSARKFIRVQDISAAYKGTHASLNNHCGAGAPGLAAPLKARCAKPFRELSIRWNGDIAICCNDWRGVYKCGNVVKAKRLDDIWNGAEFASARKYLVRGDRGALKPCDVCDAKSYRVGLLPDKKGKVVLPPPTKKDAEVVRAASSGRSYTKAVIRPWEITRRTKGANDNS